MNTYISAHDVIEMTTKGLTNVEIDRRALHENERYKIQHTEVIARLRKVLGMPRSDADVDRIWDHRCSDIFSTERLVDLRMDNCAYTLRRWQDMARRSATGYVTVTSADLDFLLEWSGRKDQ